MGWLNCCTKDGVRKIIFQLQTSFSSFTRVISVEGVHMLPSLSTGITHIMSSILPNKCPFFSDEALTAGLVSESL
jgi:hypothetical protein